ncbi:acyltransferase family protein [Psychrobacter lutiphocae]|uniref:acyltransferase family protein n=1 Tax=Psychrobacter lutiphocae TaxID=540500 RepID=UPI00035ECF21|nr:acyltransferase family protein [Psychrobacter lutiphocae]
MKFRTDINGLRAVAVIAVVLFHFHAAWMPGGFAGVDVFFVISGFLMTGIIFRGIKSDNFLLSKFYMARANRIVPALAVLCISLLLFGWFYLIPLDYKMLGRHVASSMGFFSNFNYNNEAGYFDTASHQKWLLHSWSLSVEWQFYIIYPLILVLLRKLFSLESLKRIIVAFAVIGFVYCIYASKQMPSEAYYLLPSRAWEMLVGGIAYLYPINIAKPHKKYAQWLGLAAIVGSYFLISADNAWPGYLALFPVLGTFLIIQAQREDGIISRSVIAQKLGTWSYSIYLWHWPLVVAIYYFDFPTYSIFIGILLSVILGYVSYYLIEKRNWHSSYQGVKKVLTFKPLYLMILIAVAGRATYKTEGFIWHYPEDVVVATKEAGNINPYKCKQDRAQPCYIGNADNIQAIMIGDSHADATAAALADIFDLDSSGIVTMTESACPFLVGYDRFPGCEPLNEVRLQFLQQNYPDVPVFMVSRALAYVYGGDHNLQDAHAVASSQMPSVTEVEQKLTQFKEQIAQTLEAVSETHPVYVVAPIPEMHTDIPRALSKSLFKGEKKDLSISTVEYETKTAPVIDIYQQVAPKYNAQILYPALYLCPEDRCLAEIDNRPLYFDDDHLSEFGNRLLMPMFQTAMLDFAQ